MKKGNLRRVGITITAQTFYHLKDMADACGHRDIGRVVDKLVREHQLAAKVRIKSTEREGLYYVQK